ncbi:DUF4192 domain-containing protein, partial [Angustibacter peucedani]
MPRTAAPEPPVLRLTSSSDLAAAVPYLLGFAPEQSVVVVSLRSPRERVGLVARADLPPDDGPRADAVAEAVAQLVPPLVADRPASVVVLVHDELGWARDPAPHHDLVAALERGFAAHAVPVREALYVGADRVWSYRCEPGVCCPDDGTDPGQVRSGVVADTFVAHGRAPLGGREAVVAAVGPRG